MRKNKIIPSWRIQNYEYESQTSKKYRYKTEPIKAKCTKCFRLKEIKYFKVVPNPKGHKVKIRLCGECKKVINKAL